MTFNLDTLSCFCSKRLYLVTVKMFKALKSRQIALFAYMCVGQTLVLKSIILKIYIYTSLSINDDVFDSKLLTRRPNFEMSIFHKLWKCVLWQTIKNMSWIFLFLSLLLRLVVDEVVCFILWERKEKRKK